MMDTTDSASSGSINLGTPSKMLIDDDQDSSSLEVQQFTDNAAQASENPEFKMKRINRNIFLTSNQRGPLVDAPGSTFRCNGGSGRCHSPVSSMVSTALNQMNVTLKRASSAPMINQLGLGPTPAEITREKLTLNLGKGTVTGLGGSGQGPSSTCSTPTNYNLSNTIRDVSMMELDGAYYATNFLASLNNPRPRRFSASFSFSPGSPGPAPNRVSQLRRQENTPDWETNSEKEFHGAQNITQSWEDLSLASISMDLPIRRQSFTDPLFVSMPLGNSSASASASSSPAASPRVSNRFSPGLSSPSPTRKSFTSRRSLSPIATMRPSVLSIGLNNQQGLKRKSGWDDPMDCSPQPAKRMVGLLTPGSPLLSGATTFQNHCNSPTYPVHQLHQSHLLLHGGSPSSVDTTGTESSVSSVSGGGDNGDSPSPFFRPLDSPGDISCLDLPLSK